MTWLDFFYYIFQQNLIHSFNKIQLKHWKVGMKNIVTQKWILMVIKGFETVEYSSQLVIELRCYHVLHLWVVVDEKCIQFFLYVICMLATYQEDTSKIQINQKLCDFPKRAHVGKMIWRGRKWPGVYESFHLWVVKKALFKLPHGCRKKILNRWKITMWKASVKYS